MQPGAVARNMVGGEGAKFKGDCVGIDNVDNNTVILPNMPRTAIAVVLTKCS